MKRLYRRLAVSSIAWLGPLEVIMLRSALLLMAFAFVLLAITAVVHQLELNALAKRVSHWENVDVPMPAKK